MYTYLILAKIFNFNHNRYCDRDSLYADVPMCNCNTEMNQL